MWLTFKDAKIGQRVRQEDWLLQPKGYRDGTLVEIHDAAQGTPHGWVVVEFDPQDYNPQRHRLRCSTSQLKVLT